MFPPPGLIVAMLCMIGIAVGVGSLTAHVLKSRPPPWTGVTAAAAVALLVSHAVWLNGNVTLAHLVGSPDAIVWSNFSPVFVAVLVASAWRSMTIAWQRQLVAGLVPAIAVWVAYGPLFGRTPSVGPPRIVNGVHHQSTLSTCSAAAAATLLGTVGIQTTEAEMADLCLTRATGTLQLGLYRGLRRKAPTATVEFCNDDFPALLDSRQAVIASLGAARTPWTLLQSRVGHSVVILGRQLDGQFDIADPMTGGRYPMPPEQFRKLWTGEAMRIVP